MIETMPYVPVLASLKTEAESLRLRIEREEEYLAGVIETHHLEQGRRRTYLGDLRRTIELIEGER